MTITIGLIIVMIIAAMQASKVAAMPKMHFSVTTYDYNYGEPLHSDNPMNIDCLGLSRDTLSAVLVPNNYNISVNIAAKDRGSGSNYCVVTDADKWAGVPYGTSLQLVTPLQMGTSDGTVPLTEDMAKKYWDASLVYRFPASFGWGGALWVDPDSSIKPVAPDISNKALAILCADLTHCMTVSISRTLNTLAIGASIPGGLPWAIKLNTFGVIDPLGTAIVLLETAWRNLSTEQPDLVPIDVPARNDYPYQFLQTPAFSTPSSEPTR